ncbi:ATP-binding cassette domain-containing protein [Marivita hallyeonensis]|uniref:Tungstate transport system ATP-binding protein n=1 Tax=Marivita hallyeonensis TaxID=996342 RepID=A0A1M5NJ25_9RHOB|nr:ATP-binding cassette domain-containing protein [Marivita hallyeonensis]SHG89531.1 tungstate transport system ATP-binding protein [Marivita hallyeonensis]
MRDTASYLELEADAGLSATDLHYAPGRSRLIDGLTLHLPDSGIHCLIGPNGAGKSLTLRLLHGLLTPDAGAVRWRGDTMSASDRVAQAMVFQKPVLLRRSVAANVDFVLKSRRSADPTFRDALLKRVGLEGRNRQPARLLSGGEQQRLALARALAIRPRVLFLDEPTASLDPNSARLIEEILCEERHHGTLCVLVTHDVGQARRLADSVAFVSVGRIVEHSTTDAFFRAPVSREARAYLSNLMVL